MSFDLIGYGDRPLGRFDKYLDDAFGDSLFARLAPSKPLKERRPSGPPVSVSETEKEYTVAVAAPGLTREDFNVRVDRGLLTVSYEVGEENNGRGYHSFGYGSFTRSWNLPAGVISKDVSAMYRDGILTVIVGKPEGDVAAGITIEVE